MAPLTSKQKKVVVVGAGGHARVLVSLLGLIPEVELIGVADRNSSTIGEIIGSSKVVTTFEELPALLEQGVTWAVLAIGNNQERSELFTKLKSQGFSILTAIHPSAIVETDVQIGEGVVICAGAIVCAGVVVGPAAIINTGAIVDHETFVGGFAHVCPGSCLAGRVLVGERTLIGVGSRVIDKIRIGRDCVIGAGSVVVEDMPDRVVAFGVPAKVRSHV